MTNELEQNNLNKDRNLDEEQKKRVRIYFNMWQEDPREFESQYGAEAVNQLSELMRRMNAQTADSATSEEQIATEYAAQAIDEAMENPEKETNTKKITNPFQQVGHGGARGFGLLWNGVVDMGRGLIDPENHAKYFDLIANNRFFDKDRNRKNAANNMFERWKADAVKGKKGFKSAWMRAVMEEDEIDKYGRWLTDEEREYAEGMDEGGAWLKFDEIPYENEDLGLLGAISEIAVQEAVTMGPFAVIKLLRASNIARHFATKAGGSIKKGGIITKDGKRRFRSGKVRTELEGADYENYLRMLKETPTRKAKSQKRLMDIYQTEGRFIKRAPFMGGGGAYAEAEILASAMVVTGGVMVQGMFGREYSVIGEIGGGIIGPRLAMKVGAQAGDWFTYLMHRLPGDAGKRETKLLQSMGYTIKDIAEMPYERKRKIIDQATSAPWFGGVLGIGDFRGKERRALDSYRWMEKEFSSLPDDIKDKLMERGDRMRAIIDKFDNMSGGKGQLYTTIDRAMNMAWLATIREMARSRMRLGHTVKARFNVTDQLLAEKEMKIARALNKLLKELGDKKFGKTANYEIFLDGIRTQLANHLSRLSKDKADIGRQANILIGELAEANNPKLVHIFKYADPEGWAYDFSSGKLDRNSFRELMKTVDADGNKILQYDNLGNPIRQEIDKADAFNEGSLNEQVLSFFDEAEQARILEQEGAEFVNVDMGLNKDGTANIKKVLRPKSRLTQEDINANAEGASTFVKITKKKADEVGKKAYKDVKGLNVSYAKNPMRAAIDNQQIDSIIARIGERLLGIGEEVPRDLRITIDDGSKGMKDMSINRYFATKRFEALRGLRKRLGDDSKFLEEMEKLIEGTGLQGRVDPSDFIDEVTGEINKAKVTKFMNHLSQQFDVSLVKEGVEEMPLNISLGQLAKIRTSLYQNATKQITSDGHRVSGMYNYRLGKVLTDEFEKIDSLKNANKIWRESVGRPYREGIGKIIVDNPNISGDMMFQQFVKPKGGNYTAAKEDFIEIFTMENGKINPTAIDYLTKATQQFVEEGKSVPRAFLRAFSDVLDMPYKSDDMVEAGAQFFKPWAQKEANIVKQLDSLNKDAVSKIKLHQKEFENFANLNPEFNPFGVPTQSMADLFGKEAFDASSLRRAIIKDTYEGGDPNRVQAVAQYINNIPADEMVKISVADPKNPGKFIVKEISKRKVAQATLQKTLWDGAIEEVYRRRTTQGVGFQQEAVKLADDGTPIGTQAGQMFETWEVDSGAMQIYIERNAKVLGDIMSPEDFEDLVDLSSLTTLVAGDMGRQAVENFPTQLTLKSIMSRVYGVARGVISPRYVITELLIQDARFRRGQLIKDMATDPDSFHLLTDVLFKEGFANPKIRKEFASWFWGSMIRYTRHKNAEEIEQSSDYSWEEAGN